MATMGKRDGNVRIIRCSPLRALLGKEGFTHEFDTAVPASQTASPTLQVGMLWDRLPPPFLLLLGFLILPGHPVTLRRKTIPAHVRTDG